MNPFVTWEFNLFCFYVFVVAFFLLYKKAVATAEKDGVAAIILQSIAGVSVLSLAPFLEFEWPSDTEVWFLLVGASVFYAINDRLQATIRKNLDVSVFSVLGQLSTVFLVIASVTVLGGELSLLKIVGSLLIVAANIYLLSGSGKMFNHFTKVHGLAILGALVFAAAVTIDIGIAIEFNLPVYISITLLVPALMIALAERHGPVSVIQEWQIGSKHLYLGAGIAWALTIFFSLRAYEFGDQRTLIPLQAVAVLLHVVAAHIFLGERNDLARKAGFCGCCGCRGDAYSHLIPLKPARC